MESEVANFRFCQRWFSLRRSQPKRRSSIWDVTQSTIMLKNNFKKGTILLLSRVFGFHKFWLKEIYRIVWKSVHLSLLNVIWRHFFDKLIAGYENCIPWENVNRKLVNCKPGAGITTVAEPEEIESTLSYLNKGKASIRRPIVISFVERRPEKKFCNIKTIQNQVLQQKLNELEQSPAIDLSDYYLF